MDGLLDRMRRAVMLDASLYEPEYAQYYTDMKDILKKWDHLIFYADDYRDTNFARNIGYEHITILPNGASEIEFSAPVDPDFRKRYDIPDDSFLFLTVGTLTGMKGHQEVVEAFSQINTSGKHVTLILNGNSPLQLPAFIKQKDTAIGDDSEPDSAKNNNHLEHFKHSIKSLRDYVTTRVRHYAGYPVRAVRVYRNRGMKGVAYSIARILARQIQRVRILSDFILMFAFGKRLLHISNDPLQIEPWIKISNKQLNKKAIMIDLPRDQLIQAYLNADLFVFASNIEYSPLVLYESVAAGTPFLSGPAGNADEIAKWTQGGIICSAEKDEYGYTHVDPALLAAKMEELLNSPNLLKEIGTLGRERWEKYFNWAEITTQYEAILMGSKTESIGKEFMVQQS